MRAPTSGRSSTLARAISRFTHSSYIVQPAIAESGGGSMELIPILYPASPSPVATYAADFSSSLSP